MSLNALDDETIRMLELRVWLMEREFTKLYQVTHAMRKCLQNEGLESSWNSVVDSVRVQLPSLRRLQKALMDHRSRLILKQGLAGETSTDPLTDTSLTSGETPTKSYQEWLAEQASLGSTSFGWKEQP